MLIHKTWIYTVIALLQLFTIILFSFHVYVQSKPPCISVISNILFNWLLFSMIVFPLPCVSLSLFYPFLHFAFALKCSLFTSLPESFSSLRHRNSFFNSALYFTVISNLYKLYLLILRDLLCLARLLGFNNNFNCKFIYVITLKVSVNVIYYL